MNCLAFFLFHGEEILALLGGTFLGFFLFGALIAWLGFRPPRNPIIPAIVYLVLGLSIVIALQVYDNEYTLLLTYLILFPWSLLFIVGSAIVGIDIPDALPFVACLLNTLLIYGVGTVSRKRADG